ncbi:hypothetical protein KFE25_010752 [Diacronema lutheri]|uniref:Uncharacterized protein n=1 Tax=Diacronema lutheri TaxID=2081491 RepID=A0A8J6C7G9_DIALT|nr:hypothetical protein KFE25_010752 [Diacronema lutheri]
MVLDSAYLKATVGSALADGIAQAVAQLPADPVEFLGEYLVRQADAAAKVQADAADAERLRARLALHVQAEAVKAHAAEKQALMKDVQHSAEAEHLEEALAAADEIEAAYDAVLAYVRQRLGANAYVALADRPERVLPVPPAAEAPAADASAATPAGEDDEPAEPAADEGEEGAPTAEPAKHRPTKLEYVAATEADVPLLVGKELLRVTLPADGGDDDAAADDDEEEGGGARRRVGVGEGVSFAAIDDAMAAEPKPYRLWRTAITNPSVKFWYMPRKGDYLCVPMIDSTGACVGIVGVDNLGAATHLSDADCALVHGLALALCAKFEALELARLHREAAELAAMRAVYAQEEARLAGALAEAGEDELRAGAAKLRAARANLLALDKGKLAEIKGYKVVKREVVIAVKAVYYALGIARRLPAWPKTKAMLGTTIPWGAELLAKIDAFEPSKKLRARPFERALKRLGDVSDGQFKQVSFVAFLLAQWVRAAHAVFAEATKARDKAAAEGAPAADELAPEPGEEADEADGDDADEGEGEGEEEDAA